MQTRQDTALDSAPLVVIGSAEIELSLFLRHLLEGEGLTVEIAMTSDVALERIVNGRAAVALVDAELEGALDLCRAVRGTTDRCHDEDGERHADNHKNKVKDKDKDKDRDKDDCRIVVLVGTKALDRYSAFLTAGIDEGLVRPVDPASIVAAVWRNSRPAQDHDEPPLTYLDIEIDRRSRRAQRAGKEIRLTRIEFELLVFLAQHPVTVHSRKSLIAGAWPQGVFVDPRTVNIHIGRLRRRLMEHGGKDVIRTVRASGYALDNPDTELRKGSEP